MEKTEIAWHAELVIHRGPSAEAVTVTGGCVASGSWTDMDVQENAVAGVAVSAQVKPEDIDVMSFSWVGM